MLKQFSAEAHDFRVAVCRPFLEVPSQGLLERQQRQLQADTVEPSSFIEAPGHKQLLGHLQDALRPEAFFSIGVQQCLEVSRELSLCAVAIRSADVMVVPDATLDPRFVDNDLVTGPPYIRAYVGAPLQAPDGQHIGSMCVIDVVDDISFTVAQGSIFGFLGPNGARKSTVVAMLTTLLAPAAPRLPFVLQVGVLTRRAVLTVLRSPGSYLPGLVLSVFSLLIYQASLGNAASFLPGLSGTSYLAFLLPGAVLNSALSSSGIAGQAIVRDIASGYRASMYDWSVSDDRAAYERQAGADHGRHRRDRQADGDRPGAPGRPCHCQRA